jgi:hypothetical protein
VAAVFDHPGKNSFHRLLSQRRVTVEFADELPSQRPHVIDGFWIVLGDRSDAAR